MIQGGATSLEASLAVGSMDVAQIASFNMASNVTVEVGWCLRKCCKRDANRCCR